MLRLGHECNVCTSCFREMELPSPFVVFGGMHSALEKCWVIVMLEVDDLTEKVLVHNPGSPGSLLYIGVTICHCTPASVACILFSGAV